MRHGSRRRRLRVAASACAATALLAAPSALSQQPPPSRAETFNLFGVTGLIDTPAARVQPDGQVSVTSSYFGGFLRNTLNFQVLPRVEGTFRYSVLEDFFNPGDDLFDRSFDLKVLISDETRGAPAVAVGLQDFLGTGVYSGEYVVASKALRPNLTVSGGVGWGRFAGVNGISNPVGDLFPSFETRDAADGNRAGEVSFGQFLSGPEIGVFGGLEWRPEAVDGLTLKAEYADDDYGQERRSNDFDPRIPFNFGAEYQAAENLRLGAYAMYGSEVGLRATLTFNPRRAVGPKHLDPGPPPLRARAPAGGPPAELGRVIERIGPAPALGSDARVADAMLDGATTGARWAKATLSPKAADGCPADAARDIDARLGVVDAVTFYDAAERPVCTVVLRPDGRRIVEARRDPTAGHDRGWHADPAARADARREALQAVRTEGMIVNALTVGAERASIEIRNETFSAAPQAIGRTAAALANTLPPSVEVLEITVVEQGLPAVAVRLRRARLEAQTGRFDATRRSWLGAEVADAPAAEAERPRAVDSAYPRRYWALNPHVPLGLFDPDEPLRYDLRLRAHGGLEATPGLSANGRVSQRIFGELGDIDRRSDSQLPRVRSDFARYLANDTPVVERLSLDKVGKLAPDLYGRVSLGILEEMFAGASGEILWKSAGRDWGLGAELNYARQRDFDMLFGLRDYDVVTGHASLYWDTGWRGMEAQVDAGRYLAGDWGGTFSLTRRFANGWELGAFFTLTDVPFEEFGEGSFDKGIRLTIPLDWILPGTGRAQYSTIIRPLTRDGGQRLNVANRLYPALRDLDRSGLREDWGNFWR